MDKKAFRGLNAEQLAAATERNGRVLVNACAGSGKTATACAWVSGLIEEGVKAESILMLTFTRKAAEEMKNRVNRITGGEAKGMTAGTYHSVAIRMFRENPGRFGLPGSFAICDDDASEKIFKRGLKELGGEPKECKVAAAIHGLAVNLMKDPEKALREGLRVKVDGLAGYYANEKRENCLLDFDDVLVSWHRAMKANPALAAELREKWKYVMVDEVQDNSEIQYAILRELNPLHLFAVGDPNQCIYSFRGSAPSLMKRFSHDYQGAASYTLTKNYRSSQNILDVASGATAGGEAPVELTAAAGGRGTLSYLAYGSPSDEGRGVCRGVASLLAEDENPNDICVLFRSGFQSVPLEAELRRARIPYRKYGGNTIAEAADVKDFLSFVRVLHNPADKLSRIRAACLFSGVGEKTASKEAEGLIPTWPQKAKAAAGWIDTAAKLPWPKQVEYLFGEVSFLILENYPEDGEARLERLKAIVSMADRTENIADFIDQFTLDPGEKEHPEDCITLSTVHSAKGLEWKHVFLTGAGSLQMPSRRAVEQGTTSEERRLFYVAATRARSSLRLSYSETAPDGQYQQPSQYIPSNAQWRTQF